MAVVIADRLRVRQLNEMSNQLWLARTFAINPPVKAGDDITRTALQSLVSLAQHYLDGTYTEAREKIAAESGGDIASGAQPSWHWK